MGLLIMQSYPAPRHMHSLGFINMNDVSLLIYVIFITSPQLQQMVSVICIMVAFGSGSQNT